ncbi:3-hydroxyacyl-ACP dehydratase FabZ family protein [Yersinia pseudotuberculosis]|uniref:3-hydroxyacyl-ACP dehydratase FabZ family protein n=1 Tax=Yersinia pseudotuberculosis TaxID=633 RepID=UPI000345388E|nr:3-hydroxyacyl-ACP dehydratase FabZ family protein [Yersinia pseudotuberculosis]
MKNTELNFLKTNFLFNQDITNELNTSFGQDIIKKMIPHREPFLMVDNVELINIECRLIKAIRRVDEKDPVFGGHFPNDPIYPGVLQQESMFQTALILMYFLLNEMAIPPAEENIIHAVGTRVYDVFHLSAVRPGELMTIRCCITEYDTFLATAIVQITVNDQIVTVGKGEFHVF